MIGTQLHKRVVAKKQPGLGQPAGTTGGVYLRRVNSTLNEKFTSSKSNEIRTSQQIADQRLGMGSTEGNLNGELSLGSYADFMASLLRSEWIPPVSNTLSDITADVAGTFTTVAGDFLATGFKIGMVVNLEGWTVGTGNNDHYFWITALTNTIMTGRFLNGDPVVTAAPGDSVTIKEIGKHCFMPKTGHVYDYWAFENQHPNMTPVQSELFSDQVITSMDLTIPPTEIATVAFGIMGVGKTMFSGADAPYFTAPDEPTTGRATAGANGMILLPNGVTAVATALSLSVTGNYQFPPGTVGNNRYNDIIPGPLEASGSLSVLFENADMFDAFRTETEALISIVMTTNNDAMPGFIVINLPRVKFQAADSDDGETGIVISMPFVELENDVLGGDGKATEWTTIWIQDSEMA